MATKRYTLNVDKDVYLALVDLRTRETHKTGKAPTASMLLRKLLKLPAPAVEEPKRS